ncbi:MAG: regulatory protein RecX [Desulfobacula sp.]|jgi:regulatory protein|uniref:regulatory protein RecX n=1 Tax=Desulfobacula sp. TaxID=2593537 RepID=UPI001D922586|nr:regulatory protein RecX [Desulfobacula sp.]MBT3486449.1 regulatory protein RecX [Desulfobacula sp.]MBT3805070.1 regulatory protein RecX [Desulfobacula sp.]MBT4025572.1 regulatory protein RecX [Desulfobacula sp.]MBT4199700.1 regulatory protein RecX [Desulfobacula sp.]
MVSKTITSALNLAVAYLSYQPRTIQEMQKYLKNKGFSEDIEKKIIAILLDKNYLNDKEFARLFIETRIKTKPKSKFALQYELEKKGINSYQIETLLEVYDDQDLALKAAETKIKIWQNLDPGSFKKKMMNFLRYRGFNYDICISTMKFFLGPQMK